VAFIAAPILVGPAYYIGNAEGGLFGIEADEGDIGWRDVIPGKGEIQRPPIFADNTLIFTSHLRGQYRQPSGTPACVAYIPGAQGYQPRQPDDEITLDGKLDEDSWNRGLRLSLSKSNGFQAKTPVEGRMLWDAKNIYLGFTIPGANPQAAATDRDGDVLKDDNLTLYFEPRNDGLCAYQFSVNARNTHADALIVAPGGNADDAKIKAAVAGLKLSATGAAWNPNWESAVATQPDGWTVEIKIPIESLEKTLPPPNHGAVWHFNWLVAQGGDGSSKTVQALTPSTDISPANVKAWCQVQFLNEKPKK
jgi:hypothetical protein